MTIVGTAVVPFYATNLKEILGDVNKLATALDQIEGKRVDVQFGTARTAASMRSMATNLKGLSRGIDKFIGGIVRVPQRLARFADGFVHLGQVMSTFAYRMTLVTVPITAFMVKTGKAAIELEKSTLKIATQLDMTVDEAVEWSAEVAGVLTDLAIKTGISATDISAAMYHITSSMEVSEEAALAMLEPIAKAAVAGVASAETVAKAVIRAFNVFGEELSVYGNTTEQVTHIVDVLFEAVKKGTAELEDMAVGFGRAAGMGKFAGATLEEVTALIAGLSRVFTAPQAVTTTENLFKAMVDQSEKMRDVWTDLGIAMYKILPTGEIVRRSPLLIFLDLVEKLRTFPAPKVEEVMNAIFPNLRGLRGALLLKNYDKLLEVFEWSEKWAKMKPDVGGVLQGVGRAFAIMSKGLEFALDVIQRLGEALGRDVFAAFRDDIGEFVDGFTELLTVVRELDPAIKQQAYKWMMFMVAIGPVALIAGTLLMGLGGLVTTIAALLTPMGIAGLVLAWRAFGDVLSSAWGMVQDYTSEAGLKGLAAMVADLAVEFGLLDETDAARILESLGISTQEIDSKNFKEFVQGVRDFGESAKQTVDKVKEWIDALTTFIDQTAKAENTTGKVLKFLQDVANAILRFAGSDIVVGITGIENAAEAIDALAASLLGLWALSKGAGVLAFIIGLLGKGTAAAAGAKGIAATVTGLLGKALTSAIGLPVAALAGIEGLTRLLHPEGRGFVEMAFGPTTPEEQRRLDEALLARVRDQVEQTMYMYGAASEEAREAARRYWEARATVYGREEVPEAEEEPYDYWLQQQLGMYQIHPELLDAKEKEVEAAKKVAEAEEELYYGAVGAAKALDALAAIGMAVGGEWWERFKAEHGGRDPTAVYKKHERPLQAALIDKLWSEDFARKEGRSPTEAEWKQHWYQQWMPLELWPGGPIAEPGEEDPYAKKADALLNVLKSKVLPGFVKTAEDIERAWNKKYWEKQFENADNYLEKLKGLREEAEKIKPPVWPAPGEEEDDGESEGGEGEEGEADRAGKGPGLQFGGYAWADKFYRLAEGGRREFVIGFPALQQLERSMGVVTQQKLMGMGGSSISIGTIMLPGVTDAQGFMEEMRALAENADGLARVGYGS